MSIASEIERLQQAKADIAEAIAKKGGEVSGTIDTYAQAIEALPSGGGDACYNIVEGEVTITSDCVHFVVGAMEEAPDIVTCVVDNTNVADTVKLGMTLIGIHRRLLDDINLSTQSYIQCGFISNTTGALGYLSTAADARRIDIPKGIFQIGWGGTNDTSNAYFRAGAVVHYKLYFKV